MRAIPERELVWWVQKVIWLAEGYTMMEHFLRTYHTMFVDKCRLCNGAGIMTCPSCKGYKSKMVQTKTFRLSDYTRAAGTYPKPNKVECEHCGGYCDWDAESEWQERWQDWETKLAYYDRTYGDLYDEFYEDVLHEGNLEEDTPHEEAEPWPESDLGPWAELDRELAKEPRKMDALMKRYEGHPYENYQMLPYKVVDPTKSYKENYENMGYHHHELPPELHPEAFPEYLISDFNPITRHDQEIRMEALIMRNLEAAIRNQPKPYMFEPTAGTVPCPSCQGTPWYYRLSPNFEALTRTEPSFWMRTIQRMGMYNHDPQQQTSQVPRHYAEYPRRFEAPVDLKFRIGGEDGWTYPNKKLGFEVKGHKEIFEKAEREHKEAPFWMEEFGRRLVLTNTEDPSNEVSDILSEDPMKAMDQDRLLQGCFNQDFLTGENPTYNQWLYEANTPAKRLARKYRDMQRVELGRELGREQPVWQYLQDKDTFRAELNDPLEFGYSSSEYLEGQYPLAGVALEKPRTKN